MCRSYSLSLETYKALAQHHRSATLAWTVPRIQGRLHTVGKRIDQGLNAREGPTLLVGAAMESKYKGSTGIAAETDLPTNRILLDLNKGPVKT